MLRSFLHQACARAHVGTEQLCANYFLVLAAHKCDKYRLCCELANANFANLLKLFRKKCELVRKSIELG